MVNITATSEAFDYMDSVLGEVSYGYSSDGIDFVDEHSFHVQTTEGVKLYNVLQYSFNGQEFTSALDAIMYLQTL